MKKLIGAGVVLTAVFAVAGQAHAYVNYPWCAFGEGRGRDCVFTSKQQCSKDGRGRGFGGQCIQNSDYNPALGPVVSPGPAAKGAQFQTTGPGRRNSPGH
jgi:hypothetical protein